MNKCIDVLRRTPRAASDFITKEKPITLAKAGDMLAGMTWKV